ncbi:hypothetical protein EI94DRAFT_1866551 [Lactarius quietus]|nr:hypothetical protein EI94DRAFT_1866551 [Lactarius quietus]
MDNVTGTYSTEDHTELLATKWGAANEFRQNGMVSQEGPFTESEAQSIREALCEYREVNKLSEDEVDNLIFGALAQDGFWTHLVHVVPQRRLRSVYNHVWHANHPSQDRGKWKESEDTRLKQFVWQGLSWTEIGNALDRMPTDFCDRYEKHLSNADARRQGSWSMDEEARLLHIIQDMGEHGKTPETSNKFWKEVSDRMDKTRSAKQCSNKWNDSLSPTVRKHGRTPRWRPNDSKRLVQKITHLDLNSEDEIRWNELIDEGWNHWTGSKLQKRWVDLKKAVNSDDGTHREVVQRLVNHLSTSRVPSSS